MTALAFFNRIYPINRLGIKTNLIKLPHEITYIRWLPGIKRKIADWRHQTVNAESYYPQKKISARPRLPAYGL